MENISNKYDRILERIIVISFLFIPLCSPLSFLLAFVALILFSTSWRERSYYRPKIFWVSVLTLMVVSVFSAVFSINRSVSLSVLPIYIFSSLFCFMISCSITDYDRVFKVLIIAGLLVTGFGIVQYLTNFNVRIRTDFFSMSFSTESGITSTLSYPNRFAQFLTLLFPFAAVSIYRLRDLRWKVASSLLVTFLIVCVFLTRSFAAISAIFIMILVGVFIKNWKIGIVLLLLISIIFFTNPERTIEFAQKFTSESSLQTRFNTWQVALSGFRKNPLTGCGLSNFQGIANSYRGEQKIMHGHAHSMYFQLLCETGILGLGSFLFLLLLFLYFCFKRGSPISYSCAFSILGFLLSGITGTIIEFFPLAMFFWIILGIGIGEYNKYHGKRYITHEDSIP